MCTSGDIVDSLHGESLLCSLNEQRMQGFLCDVTIVVEDTKFKAHRNILAASSLYFRNQFRSQSLLIQGHVLELNDFKADTFTEILNFIYCSKIVIKEKESLTDLADAGKKLGITFLENIKTSKRSSAVACSTEPQVNVPPAYYRAENGLKSETGEKKGDDPAITNGPRITNAFSILETGVNGFSPLDLRANFKKSNGPSEDIHNGSTCNNSASGEPVNTLAEHSYAVSSGETLHKKDSLYDHGKRLSHTRDKACSTPTVTNIRDSKPANKVLDSKSLNPQAVGKGQNVTTNDVSCSSEQKANQVDFHNRRENESTLPQLSTANPPVTQTFCDDMLDPLPEKHQGTYNCKNCCKEFAHFKRLQRHEQICFKVVHIDRSLRLPSTIPQSVSNPSEMATNQSSFTNGPSSATDHFVKIVDDKIFYVCIVCKRNYLTLSSLRRHSNVHSWRKSYPCHYCNKVFALAEYRTKHEIWHTGDRRYQCIFCLETFMTYYILKNHQKSSHGIDPRVSVGSKANRSLKSGIYPYKLYRLLPMKCKRPPLKTQKTGLPVQHAIHFQNQNSFTTSTMPNIQNAQPFALDSQDTLSSSQNGAKSTMTKDNWPFDISQSEKNSSILTAEESSSPPHVSSSAMKQSNSPDGSGFNEDQNISSVVDSTNCAPSVIMHSSRVSSVIMHGNSVTGAVARSEMGRNHSHTMASPEKEDSSQDSKFEAAETRVTSETDHPGEYKNEETYQDDEFSSPASSKKSKSVIRDGNKTETYIAKPALPGTLVSSGIAPLCQITVKIGSEALVKRQISGSSLFFRKTGRPKHSESKSEKTWLDSDDDKKERCSIRLRRTDLQMEEMCDDASDQDVSDKPWRPYYNYKPKKKSKHFKKFRKLKKRKKHSRQRPEEIVKEDTRFSSDDTSEENTNKAEGFSKSLDSESHTQSLDELETIEQESSATEWQMDTKDCFCELCQKSFRNLSTLKVHMRCHTGEKPYACKACGKCFSFPGNLSKHERIHQDGNNFMCQYCDKTFTLHKSLKKHERIHAGEKTYDCKYCSQQFLYLSSKNSHEQIHLEEQSEKGFVCVQCSKVCKTAAALAMHQKKHYFRGLKHRQHKETADMDSWDDSSNNGCSDSKMSGEMSSLNVCDNFSSSLAACESPLLSYSSSVTEVIPQTVHSSSPVLNVDTIGESDSSHFMAPPPPPPPPLLPPATIHSSVLTDIPKGWKHWKARQYSLEESLNSDHSSLKESSKTFTELKTMSCFDNPFVP